MMQVNKMKVLKNNQLKKAKCNAIMSHFHSTESRIRYFKELKLLKNLRNAA